MRSTMTMVLALTLLRGLALAEIPTVISYQGKVTDASGNPVADGPYTMQFRIYDAATGGTLLWNSNNQTVAVSDGIFSVLLGDSPQPALSLAFSQDYWLLVTFEGVNQTPRQRLASTGYAYMASGVVPGTLVSGSVTDGTLAAIAGTNTASTGVATYGVTGQSGSPAGAGVYGHAYADSGVTFGVWGQSGSTSGRGIYGHAYAGSGTTYGVYGRSESTSGTGVYGHAYAYTGVTSGVRGESYSPSGQGVYGFAHATTGAAPGVSGKSVSTGGRGVYGEASANSGTTYGGWFESYSTSGCGVYGVASATIGSNCGVLGTSSSTGGIGVSGLTSAVTGLAYGVCGQCISTAGRGVYGIALATSGTTYGVYGKSYSSSGYGVYYEGGLGGTGLMRAIVRTSQGPTGLDAVTAAGSWVEDFGEGQLVDGRCHIELDPIFLETVTIDAANPMHVFVQPNDETCAGPVVKKGVSGFDVVSPLDPNAAGAFSYRVVAKRKGFEAKRLDVCEAARNDSYLYTEAEGSEEIGARREEQGG